MPGDVVRLYVFATNLESGAPCDATGRLAAGRLLFVNLAFTDAERRRAERLAQHERERSKERA